MIKNTSILTGVACTTLALSTLNSTRAEGTEALGTPAIPISTGTDVVAGGTGLWSMPGTINLNIPVGATIKQVLLYWEGDHHLGTPSDSTIVVEGVEIQGSLIGGPTVFFSDVQFSTYRADVTALNLVGPGLNSLTVSGLANSFANNGAGILAIIDDGSGSAVIDVRDGQDLAFFDFAPPLNATVPQTFNFAAQPLDRVGTFTMFFASNGNNRPNEIDITVNGATTTLVNPLGDTDGAEWDTLALDVAIPAGATSVTIEPISTPSYDPLGASLTWVGTALKLPLAPPFDDQACWLTGGGTRWEAAVESWLAEHGPSESFGGNVFPSCDPQPGNGGSWTHISHGRKLHFHGTDILTVSCGNVPGIEPGSESPVTPVNYIEFQGFGTLKGIKGSKVDHGTVFFFARCEDRNEPGSKGAKAGIDIDRYFLHVFDANGNTLLLIDGDADASTVDPITITGGNLQIHASSCDDPPQP